MSSRAAFTYRVVTVKLATVWTGICRPWMISAGWLFWVVTLGEEMIRPLPDVSRAERATSSRKVSRTLANEKPTAVLKAGAGQVDGVAAPSGPAIPLVTSPCGMREPSARILLGNWREVWLP